MWAAAFVATPHEENAPATPHRRRHTASQLKRKELHDSQHKGAGLSNRLRTALAGN
jgi:hypothetical protein